MQKIYRHLAFVTIIILSLQAKSQTGRIKGTIIDGKTGETLTGATVRLDGTTKGAAADLDGKYAINNVPAGKVTLVVSYISYTTKKIPDIIVKDNDVVTVDIKLEQTTNDSLQEVVIVGTLDRSGNVGVTQLQKENISMSDGVSAETATRTADRNSSDLMKRISGVTMIDDKYVVVRGLNERYNASYLNGAPLPSTEPDKKAFSYDLFPSNMLDNIIVNKTATPDMPSEFAGGIIQVNTKSIPDKNFLSVTASTGYNTITTGQSKVKYPGGKLDYLGFDDGSRALPSGIPSLSEKASWIANTDQARMAKLMPNDWSYSNAKFGPNQAYQLATGYNFKRKDKDFLGVIFSAGYNQTQNLYTLQRAEYDGMVVGDITPSTVQKEREYFNRVNQTLISTGILLNLTAKLDDRNSLSLRNIFCGAVDNRFVQGLGSNNLLEQEQVINRVNTRYFSANRIYSSQLSGDHFFEKAKLKIQWVGGFSNVNRTVPDFRTTSYSKYENFREYDPSEGPNLKDTMYRADVSSTTGPAYAGYRVYNSLVENMYNGRLDISRLFKLNQKWKMDAKAGGLYQVRDRQFDMRSFGLNQYSNSSKNIYFADSLLYLPENQIFAQQNMGVIPNGAGGFKLFENTKADDNYHANSFLAAAYGMGEFRYTEKFRAIAGVRFENYHQVLTVKYPTMDSVYVSSTVNDILPSVNLIYNFTEKFSLRGAYYKTLNRPEFRELAKVVWYDPETRLSLSGSPTLVRSYIQNGDLRFEYYPGRGQLFTATGFYKYFNSPIERYMLGGQENQIVYKNANFAHVYGAELEFRVILGAILKKDSSIFLNNLSLFSNLSLIKSIVNVEGINDHVANTRPMQGQAPYVVNAGITYSDKTRGFSFTMMLNKVGPRIYIVGNDQIPDRWENSRTVVDLQATKSFFKNKLDVRFNIRDLFQQNSVIYYKGNNRTTKNNYQKDVDYINFKRNFGSTISVVIAYRF